MTTKPPASTQTLNERTADLIRQKIVKGEFSPGQRLSEDELREFCRGRIAHYKIPRHIRFVEGFPMTVTGKIQKFRIREAMKAQLGLQEAKTA